MANFNHCKAGRQAHIQLMKNEQNVVFFEASSTLASVTKLNPAAATLEEMH